MAIKKKEVEVHLTVNKIQTKGGAWLITGALLEQIAENDFLESKTVYSATTSASAGKREAKAFLLSWTGKKSVKWVEDNFINEKPQSFKATVRVKMAV
jgi:hypothetical protein